MSISKNYFSFIIFLLLCISLNAQNSEVHNQLNRDSLWNNITNIDAKIKTFSNRDTTKGFSAPLKIDTVYTNLIQDNTFSPLRDNNGLLIIENDWTPFSHNTTFRDTVIFEPAYLPVVFDGKVLPSNIDFRTKDSLQTDDFHLISPDSTFATKLKRVEDIEAMRRFYYMNNPQKIKLNAFQFKNSPVIEENAVEQRNPFKELITAGDPIGWTTPEVEKIRIKPVYWLKNGEHRLQLTYNTYSDKWGGDNNFDLFSHQKFNINYKKGKVRFENLIEWRFQLKQITSVEDKDKEENKNKGKINIIDDFLRTYSTFSLEAFYKKWFYSTNLEMKTPVFDKKTTDVERKYQRGFLTPFELNLGVGMRYETENVSKRDKYRKFKVSTDLSLLSMNYKYLRSDYAKSKDFGIEEEKRSKTDFGSTFNVNLFYSHNRYTKFNSRLKYFTNYEKVNVEWESSVDFALNNYFSTTLYLYVKYDDGIPYANKNNDKTWGYFNYNQMLRFGLTYTW